MQFFILFNKWFYIFFVAKRENKVHDCMSALCSCDKQSNDAFWLVDGYLLWALIGWGLGWDATKSLYSSLQHPTVHHSHSFVSGPL